jgi:hypothetical protein
VTPPGASGLWRDADGRLVLVQWPNPALGVFLVTLGLRLSPWDARDTELLWLGRGAIIAWAADELLRGDAVLRRVLGAVVLTWQAVVLLS